MKIIFGQQIKRLILLCALFSVLCTLTVGCEAFAKKFVRKPKKTEEPVEMVLEPQDYPEHPVPNEDLYREAFTFWKYWQDELISSLNPEGNRKKQRECILYAIENLQRVKSLLISDKAKLLDEELNDLISIKQRLNLAYLSVDELMAMKLRLENQKTKIDREFVYSKVKNYLLR